MKLRPIGKVIVLKQIEKDDISKGGLYLPDQSDNMDVFNDDEWNIKRGEILSIGEDVTKVKVGDKVIVKHNSMLPLTNKKEGELRGIVEESDILVIMEEEDEKTR